MKLYTREIKPYIQPPQLQGFNCRPFPVNGYDWVPEDLENKLRDEIIVSDPWSKLIFVERFVVWGEGIIGEFEGIPISSGCKKCEDWQHERLWIDYKFCPYCGRILTD